MGVLVVSQLSAGPALAAEDAALVGRGRVSCEALCRESEQALCHVAFARYLIDGTGLALPDCVRSQALAIRGAEVPERVAWGLSELELAERDSAGAGASAVTIQRIRAGAFILLARHEILANQPMASQAAFGKAREAYQQLLRAPSLALAEIPRVAVGLIRAGGAVEAIEALQRLPPGDADRQYLTAEALFSLGARGAAAMAYGKWVSLGCASDPLMISLDECGTERWVFVEDARARGVSRCARLPEELRARLDAMRRETP